MKYYYNKQNNFITGYENYKPTLTKNDFEVSELQYNEYKEKREKGYNAKIDIVNNEVVISYTLKDGWEEKQQQCKLKQLRNKRKPLLEAFDKYKTNVLYGITYENATTKLSITSWYNDLLDLKETAFTNVPSEIKYYL